ncbi:MAG: hypothetical protein KGI45_00855 [Patescibacteria group bacterium]|nr:hypothetical protein [Patescibacteria group bacterium]MDE1941354.1 hypothetical protein [Patescibacteria group bacterium]MDE1966606.1 hypothetical protein [Patescibacteria group bacterium]
MEPKFQTSFIPKKVAAPAVSFGGIKPSRSGSHIGSGIFMTIATVLFLVSVAALVGSYLWRGYLVNQQDTLKKDLADREQQFNISLMTQLKSINVQIDTARQLLVNHIAVSQIFGILSKFTIQDVRFLSMDLSTPASAQGHNAGGGVTITMTGRGTNLSAVAFQSDVLDSLGDYGLTNIVKNPIISDPSVDQTGLVSFGFTATVDPASLSYEQEIDGSSNSSANGSSNGSTTTSQ